jgi:antitoxin HicB
MTAQIQKAGIERLPTACSDVPYTVLCTLYGAWASCSAIAIRPKMKKRPKKLPDNSAPDDHQIGKDPILHALKQVIASQLLTAMKSDQLSKARLAILMKTSRTQVDRLLDPQSDVTLSSLVRAAAVVGRRVNVELL